MFPDFSIPIYSSSSIILYLSLQYLLPAPFNVQSFSDYFNFSVLKP